MSSPLFLDIKRNSLDDGPGIRTTVFFKGCPLRCAWCHNPEAQHSQAELMFDANRCIACNACIDGCPEHALSRTDPGFVDRTVCNLCFQCTELCPSTALSIAGKAMTVEKILAIIEKDTPFFANSGGGVTLSGGEPTLFPETAGAILAACRERGIHTLLETCGHFDRDRFLHMLYPHLNLIYFDIKIVDPELHRNYCGQNNETIMANLTHLAGLMADDGVEVLPRVPLVPAITATEKNLKEIAQSLSDRGFHRVALLPYNPTWTKKPAMLGRVVTMKEAGFMSQEDIELCKSHFKGFTFF